MPAEGWRQLARSTKQAGDVGLLCGLQAAYAEKQDEKYDKVFKNFYTRVEYVDDLTAVEAAADKFTVYLPNDDSQKAFDRIYGAFHTGNGGAFSVAVAGRNWVDVMNPGVHKGAALAKVGALLGIPADSMMAFGDTYNDAEMLTTAKYGFLMENGSGPLRAQVPFLAPSHRIRRDAGAETGAPPERRSLAGGFCESARRRDDLELSPLHSDNRGNNYFSIKSARPAGLADLLFHGKGT